MDLVRPVQVVLQRPSPGWMRVIFPEKCSTDRRKGGGRGNEQNWLLHCRVIM